MGDREQALFMLSAAERDLADLRCVEDSLFSDESFGFHAQQATEKAMKAWLSFLGEEYPRTHDLALLYALLLKAGIAYPKEWEHLIDLAIFAVRFRYECMSDENPRLDRHLLTSHIGDLISRIREQFRRQRA